MYARKIAEIIHSLPCIKEFYNTYCVSMANYSIYEIHSNTHTIAKKEVFGPLRITFSWL